LFDEDLIGPRPGLVDPTPGALPTPRTDDETPGVVDDLFGAAGPGHAPAAGSSLLPRPAGGGGLSPAVAELPYGLDWMAGAPPGFDGPAAGDLPDDLSLTVPTVYWMGDEDWDREDRDDRPGLVPVEGGLPLLYRGKSHLVFGAGTGKSWFVLSCVAQVLRAGQKVLYLGYEMNRAQVKARLRALGVTREQAAGLAYWRVTGGFSGDQLRALGLLTGVYRFALVALDSVSKAMATLNLNENRDRDYQQFDDAFVIPLTFRDITVLMIDHAGHDQGGKSPRRVSGKRDVVSGASYHFTVKPANIWTRDRDGQAEVTVQEDRGGYRAPGSIAAVMRVAVHDGGARLDIRLQTPTAATGQATATAPRGRTPFDYADGIVRHLEGRASGTDSGKGITERAGLGRNTAVREALQYLVAQGYVEAVPGRGGGMDYRLAAGRTYRGADDPNSDTFTPASVRQQVWTWSTSRWSTPPSTTSSP
jgi:hypothetical protein